MEAGQRVARDGLSVRETEALVRLWLKEPTIPAANSSTAGGKLDPNIASLQQELSDKLGAAVLIQAGRGGKGKLVVTYNSLDELDGILAHIR